MAILPSGQYLIQMIGDDKVILFDRYNDDEIVRFDPRDADATAKAQHTIYESKLSPEDKAFAHFWCGYFYAFGTGAYRPIEVTSFLDI